MSSLVAVGAARQYPWAALMTPPSHPSVLPGQGAQVALGSYLKEYEPGGHCSHWLLTSTWRGGGVCEYGCVAVCGLEVR